MRNGTHILQRVALLLQGILGSGLALNLDLLGMNFERLLCVGGHDQIAANNQCSAYVLLADILEVLNLAVLENDLKILEGRTVVELDKAKSLGRTDGTYPTANGNGAFNSAARKKRFDFSSLHNDFHPFRNRTKARFSVQIKPQALNYRSTDISHPVKYLYKGIIIQNHPKTQHLYANVCREVF
jgi:hypothetical protein